MNSSKNIPFIIILILACFILPVVASEPNEPNEPNEPKKEVIIRAIDNRPEDSLTRINFQPPYASSCFAAVFIQGNWQSYDYKGMFDTSAGKNMYYLQRELISKKYVQYVDYGKTLGGYTYFRLYAIGTEEAKNMVKAFIEDITKKAQVNVELKEKALIEYEKLITEANAELIEKESKLEDIDKQYQGAKSETHKYSSDDKAFEQAIKSTEEMDKVLNEFEIEIAGIRARMKAIENYRKEPVRQSGVESKLNEMYIELMIELTGLQAKQEMTENINMKERNFLNWHKERGLLSSKIKILKKDITNWQSFVDDLNSELKEPTITMKSPHIFNNSVTIYRYIN